MNNVLDFPTTFFRKCQCKMPQCKPSLCVTCRLFRCTSMSVLKNVNAVGVAKSFLRLASSFIQSQYFELSFAVIEKKL